MRHQLVGIVMFLLFLSTAPVLVHAAEKPMGKLPQRYLNFSGKSSLNIVNLGYQYDISDNMHLVEAGVLAFRYKWFGMSPLNFEVGFVKNDQGKATTSKWVGYKPQIQFYAPIARSVALSPYLGASVDCTYLGKYMVKGYEYDKNANFFVDLMGGLSFYLTFIPEVPFEVRAEYRYPVVKNQKDGMSDGFFVSARVHFAKPFGQNQ